nr:ABC transporter ATP-binding protein [Neisseria perflava]
MNVTVRGKVLLDIGTLDFPVGANTAVIGPNGAGKSTLLKALLGQTGKGGVTLFGQAAAPQIRQGCVAWVGQHGRYAMPMSVREYVGLSAFTYQGRLKKQPQQLESLLDYFDMRDLADKRISSLSGGEQQRANIIRALLQNAPVLLLDEPCNHLDIRHQQKLMQYLTQHKQDFSSIMVLHDLNLAARYADHIILMNQGKIFASGSCDEVMQPELLQEVYGWAVKRLQDEDGVYFRV